jgi:hypothetical protein
VWTVHSAPRRKVLTSVRNKVNVKYDSVIHTHTHTHKEAGSRHQQVSQEDFLMICRMFKIRELRVACRRTFLIQYGKSNLRAWRVLN